MFATACTEGNDDSNEVNAENLAGTWEVYVEHDFGQGYQQKYRVKFEGSNFTMWHMHQTVYTVNGQYGDLVNVGNKDTGTWEYSDGNLVFTYKTMKASYFISSMSPLSYTYYNYNTETMEADQWLETSELLVETTDKLQWKVISFTDEALTVKVNMDTFAFTRKD